MIRIIQCKINKNIHSFDIFLYNNGYPQLNIFIIRIIYSLNNHLNIQLFSKQHRVYIRSNLIIFHDVFYTLEKLISII